MSYGGVLISERGAAELRNAMYAERYGDAECWVYWMAHPPEKGTVVELRRLDVLVGEVEVSTIDPEFNVAGVLWRRR